ncbi:MAG TPA: hypothetical protein VF862_13100 [Gemmatimonadales bacterium]
MGTVRLLLWWFVFWPGSLFAQWRLGVEVAVEAFSGASGPAQGWEASTPAFRPYRPTWWGLRTEAPGHRIRPALTLRFARPDLALEGDEATVVEHLGVTDVLGVVPEVLVSLARLQAGVSLDASAGLLVERWAFEGQGARTRAGPTAGLELTVALGGRLEGVIGGALGLLPKSVFTADELPETLEPRSVWRRSLRGSIRRRL